MLLSQTGSYAVRATVHLAEQGSEQTVRVSEIAESIGVPRNYLSKVLHQLVRAGVLMSERGPRGGFALARDAHAITLAEIVRAVEMRPADRRCLLGRPECSDTDPCAAHSRWHELYDHISSFLEDTTLADLGRQAGGTT